MMQGKILLPADFEIQKKVVRMPVDMCLGWCARRSKLHLMRCWVPCLQGQILDSKGLLCTHHHPLRSTAGLLAGGV